MWLKSKFSLIVILFFAFQINLGNLPANADPETPYLLQLEPITARIGVLQAEISNLSVRSTTVIDEAIKINQSNARAYLDASGNPDMVTPGYYSNYLYYMDQIRQWNEERAKEIAQIAADTSELKTLTAQSDALWAQINAIKSGATANDNACRSEGSKFNSQHESFRSAFRDYDQMISSTNQFSKAELFKSKYGKYLTNQNVINDLQIPSNLENMLLALQKTFNGNMQTLCTSGNIGISEISLAKDNLALDVNLFNDLKIRHDQILQAVLGVLNLPTIEENNLQEVDCKNQIDSNDKFLASAAASIKKIESVIPVMETAKVTNEQRKSFVESSKSTLQNLMNSFSILNEKIPYYLKLSPTCTYYNNQLNRISELATKIKMIYENAAFGDNYTVYANPEEPIQNQPKTDNKTTKKSALIDSTIFVDGIEEDISATISYKSTSKGLITFNIQSNLDTEELILRATKKGAKTIKFSLNSDDSGAVNFTTRRNLKGYKVTLYYQGEIFDSIKIK